MSLVFSGFGNRPGNSAITETYEQAITWGPAWNLRWWSASIAAAAIDSGNSPTWRLRPGLVLGVITSTQQWTNYSPTATDGSQVARGVLAYGMPMQDYLTGATQNKFYAVIIGGQVKGANLIGLDNLARSQMSQNFSFDDGIQGSYGLPGVLSKEVTKTADYTVLVSDNGTLFDNTGAAGAVIFTLPTLAAGLSYGFVVTADQNVTVASAAGNDIVAFNDASASSLAFSTGGARVGGRLLFVSNPAGTKWLVDNQSAGANTVTIV